MKVRLYTEYEEVIVFYEPGKPLFTEEGPIEETADTIPENETEALEIIYGFTGCTGWQAEII